MIKGNHVKHFNKLIYLYISIAFLICGLCFSVFIANGVKIQNAFADNENEFKAELSENLENLLIPKFTYKSVKERPNVDLDDVTLDNNANSLPSYYNSEEEGFCPPLRDQNPYGSCWAFSAIAAAECSMIKSGLATKDTVDLSERQLMDCFFNKKGIADPLGNIGNDYTQGIDNDPTETSLDGYVNFGGDTGMTMYTLASWCGLVNEGDAPYSDYTYLETYNNDNLYWMQVVAAAGRAYGEDYLQELGFNSWSDYNNHYKEVLQNYRLDSNFVFNKNSYHVQNIDEYQYLYYPSGSPKVNLAAIKQAIYDHGAVAMDYYESSTVDEEHPYYNAENNCFYDNQHAGANHAVAIVGWDDSFPKENFNESCRPVSDGAWLVRNSWGGSEDTDYCHKGYFWMSYLNASLVYSSAMYTFDVESADNYDNNYQYDGSTAPFGFSLSKNLSLANIYDATGNKNGSEVIDAVAIGVAKDPNVDFVATDMSIQIYKNLTSEDDPTSGTACFDSPQTITINCPGYHTYKLDSPVLIEDPHSYSVVFTNISDTDISIYVEYSYEIEGFVNIVADLDSNQSFVYGMGSWHDLCDDWDCCARIKAYTNDVYEINYSGETTDHFIVDKGETITLPTCPDFGYVYEITINGEPYTQSTYTPNRNSNIVVTKVYIDYKITYDLDGGINNPENSDVYHFDSGYVELKAPTKDDYVFLGWIDNSGVDDGQKYFGFNAMDMLKEVSVKAIFAKAHGTTQVEFPVTKTDASDFNLRAEGNLTFDTDESDKVELLFCEIDKSSSEAADVIKALDVNNEVVALFKVELKINDKVVHDGFGDLNLHFILGNSYDGNRFNLHHLHSDMSKTTNIEDVEGGIINATVSDLSPFCIEKYVEVPTPVQPDEPIYTDGASTSDYNMSICMVLIVIMALASVVIKKRT